VSDWIRKTRPYLGGYSRAHRRLVFWRLRFVPAIPLLLSPKPPKVRRPLQRTVPNRTAEATVFRVKYVGDKTVYSRRGRNADLQDGMKLSVVEAPPDGVIAEGIQYRGYEHVAELVFPRFRTPQPSAT